MRPHIGITYSDEINPAAYVDAVRASGGEPILISTRDTVAVEELEGLVMAGGVDVNPALYGEDAQAETEAPNNARDAMERDLVNAALQRRLPLLAICRGMQLLNVASGGSLIQHMSGHEIRTADKALPAHLVTIERNSGLHGVVQVEAAQVNSRHHQSVNRIGENLRIVARCADGTIEAVENPAHDFVLGVQWHPEDMAAHDPAQKRLFDKLVSQSSLRRRI